MRRYLPLLLALSFGLFAPATSFAQFYPLSSPNMWMGAIGPGFPSLRSDIAGNISPQQWSNIQSQGSIYGPAISPGYGYTYTVGRLMSGNPQFQQFQQNLQNSPYGQAQTSPPSLPSEPLRLAPQRTPSKVMEFNPQTGRLEAAKVIHW